MLRRLGLSGAVVAVLAACGGSGDSGNGGDTDAASSGSGSSGASSSGGKDGGSSSGASSSSGGHDGGSSSGGDGGGSSGGGDSGGSSGGGDGGGSSSGGTDGGSPTASVLQFHDHINRDGLFVDPALTKAAAAGVHRDTTFAGTVVGNVYASPVYAQNKAGGKGTFYVATESNNVYALDETTGVADWNVSLGAAPTSTGAGCGNISPMGVTGTPAVDLGTNVLVLGSVSANASKAVQTHTIYGLSLKDGSTAWSVDVSTLKDPTGLAFDPQPQNQRGAVLIVGGIAYVAYGGHYGDCGNYHGWVVGVPLANPKGAKAWATQVGGAGIWGPGGPSSDGQSIYVATGNAEGGSNTTWAESEGLFRLDPGPSFTQSNADFFAPQNWASLDQGDTDLSGSQPLVIDAPGITPSTLVMAQGKDGYLYLVDRTNLGGIAKTVHTTGVGALHVLSGEISNAGAWATVGGTTYVVVRPNGGGSGVACPNGTSGDLVGVKLDPAAAQKMSVAWCANGQGEGSPIITTSDGANDALVWTAGAQASNALHAWDLATGTVVFAGGATADQIKNVRRFTSPIVVNGRVFVGGDNQLLRAQALR